MIGLFMAKFLSQWLESERTSSDVHSREAVAVLVLEEWKQQGSCGNGGAEAVEGRLQ